MAKKSRVYRSLYRLIRYPLEALMVALVFVIFYFLPVDASSRLGGIFSRWLGPRLGYQKWAMISLSRAFPNLKGKQIKEITDGG